MDHDAVNKPFHYASGNVECIEALEASMTVAQFEGFLKGNVMKYIWRFEKKGNPLQDLKKAAWYLNLLIGQYEELEAKQNIEA